MAEIVDAKIISNIKIFLIITLLSITSIFAGFVKNAVSPSEALESQVCLLGPQLLKRPQDGFCNKTMFNTTDNTYQPTWLYEQFCKGVVVDNYAVFAVFKCSLWEALLSYFFLSVVQFLRVLPVPLREGCYSKWDTFFLKVFKFKQSFGLRKIFEKMFFFILS